MQNFFLSLKNVKTCCTKSEKTWSVDHSLCSQVKQSLTKPSFGNQLICSNQLLVLMRVNCIPTQCFDLCQQDFTRNVILIRRPAYFNRDRAKPAALEIWSWPTLNLWDLIVKLKVFSQKIVRKQWLPQCWWVLFSLQHCFWNYWMLISLLQGNQKLREKTSKLFNFFIKRCKDTSFPSSMESIWTIFHLSRTFRNWTISFMKNNLFMEKL